VTIAHREPGLARAEEGRTVLPSGSTRSGSSASSGYQRTTVEQIAAAAEVSPSTFFRYFPTKEDLVLQDDMDTRLVEAFERQPPG